MITLDTTTFLEHKMGVLRLISNFRDKKIRRKVVIGAPHLLSLKNWIFRHRCFFWKFRKHLLRNFLVNWDEKFHGWRTENHDKRPLSYLKHFSIPELLWNTGEFLCETFRYCRTKQFQRKIVTILPPSHP